ncbi:acyltransferase, partial [bacterium]|nr:acyltransferase [bacterium]
PCVMIAFQRYSRRFFYWLFLLASLISFSGSLYGVKFHPDATFFLLPTRAWELLAGSLLALRKDRSEPTHHRDSLLGYAGLLGIFIPYLLYSQETSFPGLAAVPPVLGTAAIIMATHNNPTLLVTRFLAWKPLVGVGLISYSLYLWHWPAIVYSRMYFGENQTLAISSALVLSATISILSWKFIEQPFRRPSLLKSPLKTLLFAATCIMLAISCGHILTQAGASKWRFTEKESVLIEDITWTGSAYRTPKETLLERDKLAYGLFAPLGVPPKARDQQLDLFIWGDSHGMALMETIDEVATELGLTGKAYVRGGTVPLPFVTCTAHSDAKQQLNISNQLLELLKQQPPRELVLIARWSQLIKTDTSSLGT